MAFIDPFRISGSGLTAERLRLDLVANNLANIDTTRTPAGGPYRRRVPVFAQVLEARKEGMVGMGVRVVAIVEDQSPFKVVYDPNHPDAQNGYVRYPNVNVADEVVDLIGAARAYEANATVLETAKEMARQAIEIGRA
ncbi:flagellar basal-body rod protein FlgC [Ammonifex degensii KC4]|uniref:Flagellar basal-body rod protein FlgC n=1 Tax=Ammonifex degensii (strain DSM 10501 / KC4) TaxID=429009 RepID=C9R9Z5_AMMDK|nr:flagellar basal body rod protein FlgC [Ammonifex degensii]ACX53124.1 flagellar basal-body rod protein FlgC [Ammonifex degensii KC4]